MKNFFKKYWWLFLAFVVGLSVFRLSPFLVPFQTFIERFQSGQIFKRYSTGNDEVWLKFTTQAKIGWQYVYDFFNGFNPVSFLADVIDFFYDFLIYFVNYGVNALLYLYIFIYMFTSKDVHIVKITRSALALIKWFSILSFCKRKVVAFIKFLISQKKKIYLSVAIFFFFKGLLVLVMSEVIIFFVYYARSSFELETHLLLFSIFKSVIIWTVINIPFWLFLIISLVFTYILAVSRAVRKLQKNHDSIKAFCRFDLPYFVVINGAPSVGKTWLMSQLALATEETMIEELEENIHQIEIASPQINFGEVITNERIHAESFPDHYKFFKILNRQSSFIASVPFALLDPYADDLSIICDLDWLRPNVVCDISPLEEYTIIIFSEADKEYNSHYSKKEVGEDGLYIFFGIGAHYVKRKGRVFIDYQQETQVPLNIRGNSEMFIDIQERKYKMPFLLSLFQKPFLWLFKFFDSAVMQYESYKIRLMKDTRRTDRRVRKRYDYTFFYAFCRFSLFYLSRVLQWFDKFSYTSFYCNHIDIESKILGKFKINVNTQDTTWRGSSLYDSTFLSKGYELKKDKNFIFWEKLQKWSSLLPSDEELRACHSRFIDRAFFGLKDSPDQLVSNKVSDDGDNFDIHF